MEQTYFPHDKEDAAMKHTVTLSNGVSVPALGQGTWYLGDAEETRAREIDALRAGIEAGMTLLDTAENYGDGRLRRWLRRWRRRVQRARSARGAYRTSILRIWRNCGGSMAARTAR